MRSFKQKSLEAEIMDDPLVNREEYRQTLEELEKINKITGAYRPTLNAIKCLWQTNGQTGRLRILDVASGHGDTLRQVYRWAQKNNVAVDLIGLDINPLSADAARTVTPEDMHLTVCYG